MTRTKELFIRVLTESENMRWNIEDAERFAALIAQDCIKKIETFQIPVGNSAAGEMAREWTYDALKEIRDDIKKTFYVE